MDLLIGGLFRTAARSTPSRVAAAMGEHSLRYGELLVGARVPLVQGLILWMMLLEYPVLEPQDPI